MSALPKRKYTAQEYLALERAAPYKSQFHNGEIFAMAGASGNHNLLTANLMGAGPATFGKKGPYRFVNGDIKVKVSPTGLYTYPDVIVMCDKMEMEDNHGDVLLNPKILIEVTSPSTRDYDRSEKFFNYQMIDTLEEYILVAQDRPHIDRFHRDLAGDKLLWSIRMFQGMDSVFEFATIDAKIPFEDIYRDVEFPARDGPG